MTAKYAQYQDAYLSFASALRRLDPGAIWMLLIFAVVLVFISPLQAQTSQASAGTLKSSTELVLIPTVVNNGAGSHVSGLKKEDFVLKQDGKPKPIAIFEEVKTVAERVRRAEGESGTFSNIETGGAEHRRLSIIALDFVNTPVSDQENARSALLKFLTEVANSGEPMCLLALTRGGLKLLHDFSEDPKRLADGLSRMADNTPLIHEQVVDPHHPPATDLMSKALTALISDQLQSEAHQASLENKQAASLTVQALMQIAKAFRGFPGRKSLIWASSGFALSLSPGARLMCDPACPVHGQDEMQGAYDNLWKTMSDAQIAIYSVDLRAAFTAMTPVSEEGMRPTDIGDPQYDTDMLAREKTFDTDSSLRLFAENTGGRAFMGGGNLIQSFRQAIDDDSSYYLLGYYVSANNTKAGWHSVSVAVHAKSTQVRYRNGFFLSRDTSASSAQQEIRLALASPLNFTGIPISIAWKEREAGKVAGKTRVHFELVMPANFASVDDSDQNHMILDLAAIAKNTKGESVADLLQRIDVHLKPDGLDQIEHNGMTYRGALQLPPGDYSVHFAVRDAVGNRIGSIVIPVNVTQ
jgi:VWFA-related protein